MWLDIAFTTARARRLEGAVAAQHGVATEGGDGEAAPQLLHEIFDTQLAARLRPVLPQD